jgi:hypothetical protein
MFARDLSFLIRRALGGRLHRLPDRRDRLVSPERDDLLPDIDGFLDRGARLTPLIANLPAFTRSGMRTPFGSCTAMIAEMW